LCLLGVSGRCRQSAPDQPEHALLCGIQPATAGKRVVPWEGVGEDMFDIVVLAIQGLNLFAADIERRSLDVGIIVQGDEQNPGAIGNDCGQVPDIVLAHLGRQGNQCGPVVYLPDMAEIIRNQLEEITTPEFKVVMSEGGKRFTRVNQGFLTGFLKEILAGHIAQFHSDNRMAPVIQPPHIVGFAAQGDKHCAGIAAGQFRPVVVQVLVDAALVKTYFTPGPALMPEFVFHSGSILLFFEVCSGVS